MNDQIVLEASHLGKAFNGKWAVENVNVQVRAGQICTIIGPNGSGKTTLLRLLLNLLPPDAGTVFRAPGLKVGYMPQTLTIHRYFPLHAGDFLQLHAHRHRPDATNLSAIATELGVLHALKTPLSALSGGELQRVMLARALLCQPELLVLDEPVQGVDVAGQAALYALIAKLARARGMSVLMVSHDLHLVMAASDEVLCLHHHVCCAGHPHAVQDDPAFIALFGAQAAKSLAIYTHHHDHTHPHD